MTDAEFDTTLVYAGRRLSGTKCLYAYVVKGDAGGRERYFGKPLKRGVAIGGTFVAAVGDYSDEHMSVGARGESGPQIDDEQQIARWSAEDKAVAVMLAKITNDRKRAREAHDPIDDAIAVLRAGYFAQRSIAARAAFADYVTAAIAGAR
ncbi:hypothetical protein PBI_APPA_35 [Microbacterium phage Appa]|uniref:Uncharacterized protein n=1 Tax=Microbacterium phage Appa TaxID=2182350 RepID=A0A2U8UHT1_9CAUD|nr:hypothetical protein HOT26_gp35 [Microbacterium phage Appa]AWN03217.1 hypothetical protein PBI_APPA_35 [Microbacterium phage Appa]